MVRLRHYDITILLTRVHCRTGRTDTDIDPLRLRIMSYLVQISGLGHMIYVRVYIMQIPQITRERVRNHHADRTRPQQNVPANPGKHLTT